MLFHRNKTFNYKSHLYNISSNDTRTYETDIISCNSNNSKGSNHHDGDILTRYFRIIQNKILDKMRAKGPNYRKPKVINWKKERKCRQRLRQSD